MTGIINMEAFLLTAIIDVITPGVDTIMVLTRSISRGRAAGLYSALGVGAGLIFHTCSVGLGLSLVIARSAIAFGIIKYAGAVYLLYIGVKAITSKTEQVEIKANTASTGGMKKMFLTAFISDILNPKIAIFFLAFLPQFIEPGKINAPVPYLLLGLIMFCITLAWCSFLALMGSRLATVFNRNSKLESRMNRISGIVFILLGLKVALTRK